MYFKKIDNNNNNNDNNVTDSYAVFTAEVTSDTEWDTGKM